MLSCGTSEPLDVAPARAIQNYRRRSSGASAGGLAEAEAAGRTIPQRTGRSAGKQVFSYRDICNRREARPLSNRRVPEECSGASQTVYGLRHLHLLVACEFSASGGGFGRLATIARAAQPADGKMRAITMKPNPLNREMVQAARRRARRPDLLHGLCDEACTRDDMKVLRRYVSDNDFREAPRQSASRYHRPVIMGILECGDGALPGAGVAKAHFGLSETQVLLHH